MPTSQNRDMGHPVSCDTEDGGTGLAPYCGGGVGCGCCLSLSLSLPPPKIFWKKFFFLGAAGGWVVSGALPSGGVLGLTRTMGAGVFGGDVVSGEAGFPPMPRIFWMKFCGLS